MKPQLVARRLTIDVIYQPNQTPTDVLETLLDHVAQDAFSNGSITGHTHAEVFTRSWKVQKIPVKCAVDELKVQGDLTFDGKTFDKALDTARLGKQLMKVFQVMRDGQWRTLQEISELVGAPQQSVSARLRDFRKPRFGSLTVESQRRGPKSRGVWEYRL
jgi:hypothetical protein